MSNIFQALPFYLNQALGTSDTSFDVRGLKDSRGNLITAMPSGVARILVTIEPQSVNNQEIISFTGITNKGNGIVTLTGVTRNLNPVTPFTALTANVTHANNSVCIISNNPQFYQDVLMTNEARTVTAVIEFATSPTIPSGVNPTEPVNKSQLDLAVLGTVPAASTTVLGAVRVASSPNKTLGTVTMTIASPCVLTLNSHGLTLNDTVTFTTTSALPTGIVAGTTYYVISAGLTANDFEISLAAGGSAVNTSGSQSGVHTLYRTTPYAINDQDPRLPTQDENDAMVGTSGSPSSTNKYITDADSSTTVSAGKVVRRNATGDLTVNATPTASTDAASKAYADSIKSGFQAIGELTTSTYSMTAATNQAGDSMVIAVRDSASTGSISVFRYAKDSSTGQWYFTGDSGTISAGGGSFGAGTYGVAFTASHVYICATHNSGPTTLVTRFSNTNLAAGGTTMTISGTVPSAIVYTHAMYSDGTDLYICSTTTTWYRYTISGTTITNAQTLTGPNASSAAWYDGSNVHLFTSTSYQKWPLALGSATSTTSNLSISAVVGLLPTLSSTVIHFFRGGGGLPMCLYPMTKL